MQGKLIVLEGPDGAGTTKHTELLCDRFAAENLPFLRTEEPTGGSMGKLIRTILSQKPLPPSEAIQLLFCADRADHVKSVIEPALAEGKHVICDRYALSTVIYGAAAGVDGEWLAAVNAHFPKPDITIVTLPSFEVCCERLGRRSENDEFEKKDFQKSVYDLYANAKEPDLFFVDTDGEKDVVAQTVWEIVSGVV